MEPPSAPPPGNRLLDGHDQRLELRYTESERDRRRLTSGRHSERVVGAALIDGIRRRQRLVLVLHLLVWIARRRHCAQRQVLLDDVDVLRSSVRLQVQLGEAGDRRAVRRYREHADAASDTLTADRHGLADWPLRVGVRDRERARELARGRRTERHRLVEGIAWS